MSVFLSVLSWMPFLNWIIPPYIHLGRDYKNGVIWRFPIIHGFLSSLINAATLAFILEMIR